MSDYFSWSARKQGLDERRKLEEQEREESAAPSEPIDVQEHHASTTIIERLYAVLGKRG